MRNNPLTLSYSDLALHCGVTTRCAYYIIKKLKDMGIITVVRNIKPAGENSYVLLKTEHNMKALHHLIKDIESNTNPKYTRIF
jgi:hypothetical protein